MRVNSSYDVAKKGHILCNMYEFKCVCVLFFLFQFCSELMVFSSSRPQIWQSSPLTVLRNIQISPSFVRHMIETRLPRLRSADQFYFLIWLLVFYLCSQIWSSNSLLLSSCCLLCENTAAVVHSVALRLRARCCRLSSRSRSHCFFFNLS